DALFSVGEGVVIIHGLGGLGKTQLARAYALRCREQFAIGFCIDAQDNRILCESINALADRLGIPDYGSAEVRFEELRRNLAARKDVFLLVDNVDVKEVAETLSSILPKNASILVTSRLKSCGIYFKQFLTSSFKIGNLSNKKAVEYLLTESGQKDAEAAQAIAKKLECLPLALLHTVAYVKSGFSLERYLCLLETVGAEILKEKIEHNDPYQRTIYMTWRVSLKAVSRWKDVNSPDIGRLAITLLTFICVLPSNRFQLVILDEWIKRTAPPAPNLLKSLFKADRTPLILDRAIRLLSNFSLIDSHPTDVETYSIHGLLKEVIVFYAEQSNSANLRQQRKHWRAIELLLYPSECD
ncbi:MAG: ATP-binding protein, partial [Pseudomonadales bacterium]|nr:ATP-binding protein [Pseudomonadales bacterium]